jgi:2-amino-4-hydroxy-6-hydroxymethyldihydropteridine diphosphokinase
VDVLERAVIGLGANVGLARVTLERAVTALHALPGVQAAGVSRLYRTTPVGPVDHQADFWNAALALRVPAGASPEDGAVALLLALKGLERAFGRRPRQRWGPRELDLDLLLFGDHRLHVERVPAARSDDAARVGPQWLDVPHPLAAERLFVLAPLADLLPDLVPPGWSMSVADARARAAAREGPAAVRVVGAWDPASLRWRDVGPAEGGISGGSAAAP